MSEAPSSRSPVRPKVALITSQAFSLHNFRGPLIAAFVRAGIDVYALAPDHDDASRAILGTLGAIPVDIRMSRAGLNPIQDAIDCIDLTRRLRAIAPDITLSYFIKPVIYGTLAAVLAGVPRRFALVPGLGYLFSLDTTAERPVRRLMRALATGLYAAAFTACERVIFQNQDDREWFVSRRLLSSRKVVVTQGTGVDLDEWHPVSLPSHAPVFLLIARLLREKGIPEYAAAARIIRARNPDVRCLLVGGLDPNPGALTREEVDRWVAEGVIEWVGPTADVKPWIAAASVYVLPSYYREGIPRSTQEAMAMGRPVITTDSVGCRETVDEGVNGYLVPVRDVEALVEAMMRFVTDRSLIGRMGAASRRLVEARFNVHRNNASILRAMRITVA
jgi:glycosyltransferase involved in cell wall biosynthesis